MNATPAARLSSPFAPLGRSIAEEFHYRPRVTGAVPAGLAGTLLRNGPGLFERGGRRKQHLLDGDGLIQAFRIGEDGVDYQARFVRTSKFCAEHAAGRYLYPTWTTRSASGLLANSITRVETQAGVSVVAKRGRAFAFDDTGLPYEFDPATLDTTGVYRPGDVADISSFNAHTRYDSSTGDWLLFGQEHGRHYRIHVLVLDRELRQKSRFTVTPPHATYIHDWFATPRHVVFNLHPLAFRPFAGLLGLKAFTECLAWQPERGNTVMVIDRASGEVVLQAEVPAAFMWHTLNAYERGGSIIADFVGYDEPDHFIGEAPEFRTIMRGESGAFASRGTLRRYDIDLGADRVTPETVDSGHFEFPMIDMRLSGQRCRFGYLAEAAAGSGWHDSIARIDLETGERVRYRFDGPAQVGEPVVVPDPACPERAGEPNACWLLCVIFETATQNSALAILRGDAIEDGPVARIELEHATPLSFHGTWMAA